MRGVTPRLLAMVTCLWAVTAQAARARPAPPGTIDELRRAIAAVLEREGVPGVGLALVTRDGVAWAGGVGLADRAHGRPVTADTLFRVGSITKSFIALALIKLSEEGRIDLNAPVSTLAPELAIENRWSDTQPITVAHLLEHTAGFDDMHFNESFAPLEAEELPLGQILARNPRSRVARWRPGSLFSYANPGYTVAAYLIEKVTGRRYADYVGDALLRPLGMTGASLRWTPAVEERLSRGYDERGRLIPYRAIYHHPAGNLMASPRELAALVRLWLERGRVGDRQLISEAGIARSEHSQTAQLHGSDIDYGLGNYGDVADGVRSRGHDGGLPGFISLCRYVPERGVGWVMLLNSHRSPVAFREINRLLLAYALAGAPMPRPPTVAVPVEQLRAWEGNYHLVSVRFALYRFLARIEPSLVLRLVDGELTVGVEPGQLRRVPLIALGDDRFRLSGHGGSHILLDRDRDGRRRLYINGATFSEEPRWLTATGYFGARAIFWLMLSGLLLPLLALLARGRASLGSAWPLVSIASFLAVPWLYVAGAMALSLGERNRYTVGIAAATIVFAVSAVAGAIDAARVLGRPLPLPLRLHRLAVALAAVVATIFFASFGLIGICLWRY